jgi:phosphatidylethanolamine-binding protein (PEBP) family uncharacterized protein
MTFDSRNVSAFEWECSSSNVEGNASILLTFGAQGVRCDDEVVLANSAAMPTVSLPNAELEPANYTVIIVDRDAPSASSPIRSPLRHMTLAGIPQEALARGAVESDAAEPLFLFSGPRPPAGSGCHRYYAIVYRQASGAGVAPFNVSNRFAWNFSQWALDSQLTRVGVTFWRTGATSPCAETSPPAGGASSSEFGTGALAACVTIPLLLLAVLAWRWRRAPAKRAAAEDLSAAYRVVENPVK